VVCDEVGAAYYRPAMPNSNPDFVEAMADVVLQKISKNL